MIKVKSSVNSKEIKPDSSVKVFKPYNLLPRIIFKNKDSEAFIEFSGKIKEDDHIIFNFESFLYELGYVLEEKIINDTNLTNVFKQAYDLIMKNQVEIAPDVKYLDNSNSAKITREILINNPRINKSQFIIEAGLLVDKYGYSEGDLLESIVNYS